MTTTVEVCERWRPVPGHAGYYEVSDCGRVRSVERTVVARDGRIMSLASQLKNLSPGFGGYVLAQLWRNNEQRKVRVHTLVLEAFVGPPPAGTECRHLDGNPANNSIENLAWGTSSQNKWDRVRHGNHPSRNRTSCPRGHALAAPNLTAASQVLGFRTCLACKRAHDNQRYAVRRGHPFDLQGRADQHYRKIMGGGPQ